MLPDRTFYLICGRILHFSHTHIHSHISPLFSFNRRLLTGKNKCTAVMDCISEPEQLAFECVHSPSVVFAPNVFPAHVSLGTTAKATLATASVTWSTLPDTNLAVEACCYLPVSPQVTSWSQVEERTVGAIHESMCIVCVYSCGCVTRTVFWSVRSNQSRQNARVRHNRI